MSSTEPTYGILGVGAIATAIVRGPCEGVAEAPSVVLSPRNAERAAGLAAGLRSVRVASGNQAVVDASDVVIICLLPVDAADALAELDFRADQAVVSAVAGLPVVQLAELVAPATDVARSIPLPAVATRDSITPVHPATSAAMNYSVAWEEASWWTTRRRTSPWPLPRRRSRPTSTTSTPSRIGWPVAASLRQPEADFAALARAHTTPGGLNEQFARGLHEAGVYDAVRAGLAAVLARIAPR